MKLIIDTAARTITREEAGERRTHNLYSRAGFEWLSREWVRVGWDQKYAYTFSWQGRPVIQLPEDMIRTQDVLYRIQPDVIVETGVAHGGSLIFYASLCKTIGTGRVIGVDIEIRPHNRSAIEQHELAPRITLIEGDSAHPDTVQQVRNLIKPGETVLVFLDSCHTKAHVLRELNAYAPLVTPGSYIVATDGVMEDLCDVPRGQSTWREDNPSEAARAFAQMHSEFTLESPHWSFNESPLVEPITHWPSGWLRKSA